MSCINICKHTTACFLSCARALCSIMQAETQKETRSQSSHTHTQSDICAMDVSALGCRRLSLRLDRQHTCEPLQVGGSIYERLDLRTSQRDIHQCWSSSERAVSRHRMACAREPNFCFGKSSNADKLLRRLVSNTSTTASTRRAHSAPWASPIKCHHTATAYLAWNTSIQALERALCLRDNTGYLRGTLGLLSASRATRRQLARSHR